MSHPYLASSPDALLDEDQLIEVKCPYTAKQCQVAPDIVPYLHCEDNQLHLDRSHDYYYQIQCQLLWTSGKQCVLVIYIWKIGNAYSYQKKQIHWWNI